MIHSQAPLSNLQLELLQIFSRKLNNEDLLEVKRVLANHFAQKAMDGMDKQWTKNGWSNDTMDEWLKTDFRKG